MLGELGEVGFERDGQRWCVVRRRCPNVIVMVCGGVCVSCGMCGGVVCGFRVGVGVDKH